MANELEILKQTPLVAAAIIVVRQILIWSREDKQSDLDLLKDILEQERVGRKADADRYQAMVGELIVFSKETIAGQVEQIRLLQSHILKQAKGELLNEDVKV